MEPRGIGDKVASPAPRAPERRIRLPPERRAAHAECDRRMGDPRIVTHDALAPDKASGQLLGYQRSLAQWRSAPPAP